MVMMAAADVGESLCRVVVVAANCTVVVDDLGVDTGESGDGGGGVCW